MKFTNTTIKKTLKHLILVFLLAGISNQNISAQSFIKVNGQATDVVISPKDGSVYVVGTSKNVFKYDTRSKKFKPFAKQSKNVKSIAVHSNGSLYMVSTSNEVYIDVNGRWNKIPGIKTNEVDIDKNGNVRALNLSGKLYNLYQGKWQLKSLVNKNTTGFNQIIGKDSKILFARFKDNKFKQFKSGKWNTLNGSPLKITMDDKTGEVYAVGQNKGIYKWANKWILLNNTRKDFKDVAVHNNKIWTVANDKSIYIYDKNRTPENSKLKDYSGTYRVTFTRFFKKEDFRFPYMEFFGTMGVYLEAKTSSGNIIIKPKDNKPNRVWDISKGNPVKLREKKVTIKNEQFIHDIVVSRQETTNYSHGLDIGIIREFVIAGEAANKDIVFDFQFNVKNKRPLGVEIGEYKRQKVKITNLKLNYEYLYTLSGVIVGFKIEKQ